MIKIKPNKNIIFFFSILNSIETKDIYHPLGRTIVDSIEYKNLSAFKEFKKLFKSKQIPSHPYQYCVYAINSKPNLDAKSIKPNSGFGEKTYKIYKNNIQPISQEIYKESNFNKVYEDEILNQYEELSEQLQQHFKGKVEDVIRRTWNLNSPCSFILIPNFLEVSHSFGLFRDNNLYSITAPNLKKGEIQFHSQLTISNAIHEFSHSIFQEHLVDNNLYGKHKELTKNIEIPPSLNNIHKSPHIFMEETLIKVVTILIQEDFYREALSNDTLHKKSKEMLDRLVKKGYYKAPTLYKVLSKSEEIIDSYLNTLGN